MLASGPLFLSIDRVIEGSAAPAGDPASLFAKRSAEVEAVAGQLQIATPDEMRGRVSSVNNLFDSLSFVNSFIN